MGEAELSGEKPSPPSTRKVRSAIPADISIAWRQTPGRRHVHAHMEQHGFARVFEPQLHAGVVQSHVADAGLQGGAKRRLFTDQQRQHAEIGQASLFREQKPEGFLARQACGFLQQPADRADIDHQVRIVENCGRQLGRPQHEKRIEPHGARNHS